MRFQRYEVPLSLAKECKKTPNWRRSWRPSFWGTMERHYKNVSRAVTALSVLSLYVVSKILAIWGWEIRSNQSSLALGLKLLLLFIMTARMRIFKYHWSVGILCAMRYKSIPKSIFPALERFPFSSLRSGKNYSFKINPHALGRYSGASFTKMLSWTFRWDCCSDPQS